jgi:WD40 repeat protein
MYSLTMRNASLYVTDQLIEETSVQIYSSALIFAQEMSIAQRQFKDQIPHCISRLPIVQRDWSSLEQTLKGHPASVTTVTFSPDGSRLASGSGDNTVRVWNAAKGQAEQQNNRLIMLLTLLVSHLHRFLTRCTPGWSCRRFKPCPPVIRANRNTA